MQITGTLISYYFYCHRRMWLHANDIKFEDNSEDVAMGVLIEKTSYQQRSSKYEQVEIGPIKIDFYDTKNKIIHEVKKSSKFHETHIWQIKYYIYILELKGIDDVTGVLEYPKERKTEDVFLSTPDRERIKEFLVEIDQIIHANKCPEAINKPRCKKCSYYDFCYSSESEE
ncbi:CRISPR-associated protein Cas4 [Ancylomarina longa]|uniref:CRISPR-associated exonuclease Cas4 n=1 Tax=Ancylomarina longa TaxID=2487017 RepID=A0A434ATV3_9BACT|nr:CRISPR-associated protein Cas4 [Ancylomarina longa]RUT77768.1 CRISPR-associated protein Cas4 [Ancylomarina longa]